MSVVLAVGRLLPKQTFATRANNPRIVGYQSQSGFGMTEESGDFSGDLASSCIIFRPGRSSMIPIRSKQIVKMLCGNYLKGLAVPAGLEPATRGVEIRYSIQLSYGTDLGNQPGGWATLSPPS